MNQTKVTILKNHEVTRIDWRDQNVSTVTCKNGKEFTGDFVITTTSLGHLKDNHQKIFYPSLPSPKAKAIETLGISIVGKVFLEFPAPYWTGDPSISFLFR